MKLFLKTVALIASTSVVGFVIPALGQEGTAKTVKGAHARGAQHGGQFLEAGDHHGVEMVANDNVLVFHLSEDDKPMDPTGLSFRAIIQTDTGTRILPLKASGRVLTAPLDAALPKGTKVVISGKDDHGHVIQARFVKQ